MGHSWPQPDLTPIGLRCTKGAEKIDVEKKKNLRWRHKKSEISISKILVFKCSWPRWLSVHLAGSVILIFTKLEDHTSLLQSHHKPIGLYIGGQDMCHELHKTSTLGYFQGSWEWEVFIHHTAMKNFTNLFEMKINSRLSYLFWECMSQDNIMCHDACHGTTSKSMHVSSKVYGQKIQKIGGIGRMSMRHILCATLRSLNMLNKNTWSNLSQRLVIWLCTFWRRFDHGISQILVIP